MEIHIWYMYYGISCDHDGFTHVITTATFLKTTRISNNA